MKKTLILFTLLLLTGCDDLLDEAPDNRQEIRTVEDAAELTVLAYSRGSYIFTEWLTDNVVKPNGNRIDDWHIENFRFETVESEINQDTPSFFWENTYAAIAQANQALDLLESITEIDDQENFDAVIGEALITRAYNHFMLANVFCLHYSEENKGSLGIPYITAPETSLFVEYDRGTLEETYQKIREDIEEAIPLINDDYYKGSKKYHFTKRAAYAFASRFYLFVNDYENCIKYSNLVLGEDILTSDSFRDMDEVFSGANSTQISSQFLDPDSPANLLLVRTSSFAMRYSRGYRATTAIFREIFENNIQNTDDHRDLRYSFSCCDARQQPKFRENFIFSTATTGVGYSVNVDLRAEETILNRMEAYVMTDQTQKALDDYNTFAPSRYENGGQLELQTIMDFYEMAEREAMLEFIISERRKEFLNESIRWFDIKRFNISVTHVDNTETNLDRVSESQIYTLEASDLRKAVQIPPNYSIRGIQPNPR